MIISSRVGIFIILFEANHNIVLHCYLGTTAASCSRSASKVLHLALFVVLPQELTLADAGCHTTKFNIFILIYIGTVATCGIFSVS